jgi:hypothetical protein
VRQVVPGRILEIVDPFHAHGSSVRGLDSARWVGERAGIVNRAVAPDGSTRQAGRQDPLCELSDGSSRRLIPGRIVAPPLVPTRSEPWLRWVRLGASTTSLTILLGVYVEDSSPFRYPQISIDD